MSLVKLAMLNKDAGFWTDKLMQLPTRLAAPLFNVAKAPAVNAAVPLAQRTLNNGINLGMGGSAIRASRRASNPFMQAFNSGKQGANAIGQVGGKALNAVGGAIPNKAKGFMESGLHLAEEFL